MKHPKATAWGAGVMGATGVIGAVLGPSPLVFPFVPLIAAAHAPFAIAMAAVGLPGGLAELGIAGKAAFVVWSAVLGAVAGSLVGAWRADRVGASAGQERVAGFVYTSCGTANSLRGRHGLDGMLLAANPVTLRISPREVVSLAKACSGGGRCATHAGTAVSEDYTPLSGTLTFAPGEQEKTVTVALVDDGLSEGAETVMLTLSQATGGATIERAEATGTIGASTGPAPLSASFGSVPSEHDGTSPFELEFRLSEEPAGVSYRTVQNGLFSVTGGSISRAWRLVRGSNAGWGLKVTPSGLGNVRLQVRATTDCAGTPGVCTSDGRMLGGGLQTTIKGPATLSVADAQIEEGSDAVLAFTVTLSRALSDTVTVQYGTTDGTATAGADYTATTGTLTFAVGDTSKTVSVPVLDDGHDEGSETMTLRLQSPSPTRVKLADASATGTINNSDPMPRAWITRFGRTIGGQVVDALTGRLEGGDAMHVTVGGVSLTGGGTLEEDEAARTLGLPEWSERNHLDDATRTMTTEELVMGSTFHLSTGKRQPGQPAFTAWGRFAMGGFEAEEDDVTLDDDVTTGLLGADAEWNRLLASVMVSQSSGDGSYRLDSGNSERAGDQGTVESSMTGVYPYARLDLNERVSA